MRLSRDNVRQPRRDEIVTACVTTPSVSTTDGLLHAPSTGPLTYEHDLDGNLSRRYGPSTDLRYGWDEAGRLTSVTVAATGATVNYDYNALGHLVRRRTNGVADRHFLWENDDILAELDGAAGARIGEYVYWTTDHPMALVTGAYSVTGVDYFVQDARDNVNVLFGSGANAPIDFSTGYTDWGQPIGTAGALPNRLLWKGMLYEGDSTKMYYARNRWYSPESGGFVSEDS